MVDQAVDVIYSRSDYLGIAQYRAVDGHLLHLLEDSSIKKNNKVIRR